jgi:hypothetical protein
MMETVNYGCNKFYDTGPSKLRKIVNYGRKRFYIIGLGWEKDNNFLYPRPINFQLNFLSQSYKIFFGVTLLTLFES